MTTHTRTCGPQAIIPDYIFEKFVASDDPALQAIGRSALAAAQEARAVRQDVAEGLRLLAEQGEQGNGTTRLDRLSPTDFPPPVRGKLRYVYDLQGSQDHQMGELILQPTDDPGSAGDSAAKEAFQYSGVVYDFYSDLFGRNSLDDREMPLISCVHWGRNVNNAFWDGRRMVYGDGDGKVFNRFTSSLDVIAHEMTHGVQTHTSNLKYWGESGALNEHFSDVFGVLIKQWHLGQTADEADWLIGAELPVPGNGIKAIRDMGPDKAYQDHPVLGTDPQPKHYSEKYDGPMDNNGVHINSGIPNYAFYQVAKELGGNAWEAPGRIWYKAMMEIPSNGDMAYMAALTQDIAERDFGADSKELAAVKKAWSTVGVEPSLDHDGKPVLQARAEEHMPPHNGPDSDDPTDPPEPANDPLLPAASSTRPGRPTGVDEDGSSGASAKRRLSRLAANNRRKPGGPQLHL